MYERQGSSSAISDRPSYGTHFTLLGTAILFSSIAFTLQTVAIPLFTQSTQVSWNSLAWLAEIQIGFEQIKLDPGSLSLDLPDSSAFGSPEASLRTSPQKLISHPIQKKQKSALKNFSKKRVLGKVARTDQIHWSSASTEADAIERKKLVSMHRFLTARMLIALNSSAVYSSDILLTTQSEQLDLKKVSAVVQPLSNADSVLKREAALRSVTTHRKTKRMNSQAPEALAKASDASRLGVTSIEVKQTLKAETNSQLPAPQSVQAHTGLKADSKPRNLIAKSEKNSAGDLKSPVAKQLSTQNTARSLAKAKRSGRGLASPDRPVYEAVAEEKGSGITASQIISAKTQAAVEWNQVTSDGFKALLPPAAHPDAPQKSLDLVQVERDVTDLSFSTTHLTLDRVSGSPVLAQALEAKALDNQLAPLKQFANSTLTGVTLSAPSKDANSQALAFQQAAPVPAPTQPSQSHSNLVRALSQTFAAKGLTYNPTSPVAPPVNTQPSQPNSQSNVNSQSQSSTDFAQSQPEVPPYIEAFDSRNTPLSNVMARMLSSTHDPGSEFPLGWKIVERLGYRPTLTREDLAFTGPVSVPLISETNTLPQIARWAGIADQAQHAGLIFGKIARGWGLRLPSGPEAVYFDKNFKLLSSDNAMDKVVANRDERYFVILNLPPGTQWVYLESKWGEGQGALPVPVLGETDTYLDLTQISKQTLRGKVVVEGGQASDSIEADDSPIDASASDRRFFVRVNQQPLAKTTTDAKGNFSIPNVVTVANYPFIVTSQGHSGGIHHYTLLPSQMGQSILYRISQTKLDHWLSQIDDGLNRENESGDKDLVVVAVPGLVQSFGDKAGLTPAISTVWSAIPFIKRDSQKTYTIAPWPQVDSPVDQLELNQPLVGSSTRFMSAKTPKGINLVEVFDSQGKVTWSELAMSWSRGEGAAQPRIVHIVGPK